MSRGKRCAEIGRAPDDAVTVKICGGRNRLSWKAAGDVSCHVGGPIVWGRVRWRIRRTRLRSSGPERPTGERGLDGCVQFGARDLVVVAQGMVGRGHQLADGGKAARLEVGDGAHHAVVLGHDVADRCWSWRSGSCSSACGRSPSDNMLSQSRPRAAVAEYESQTSVMARCARDADKLERLLQAVEYRSGGTAGVEGSITSSRDALRTDTAIRIADAAVRTSLLAWRDR